MRTRLALGLTAGLALTFTQMPPDAVRAQGQPALNGQVTSEAEGAMEGVVVSAHKANSIVTVSVTTDAQGATASRRSAGAGAIYHRHPAVARLGAPEPRRTSPRRRPRRSISAQEGEEPGEPAVDAMDDELPGH